MAKSGSENQSPKGKLRSWTAVIAAAAVLAASIGILLPLQFSLTYSYPLRHDDITVIGLNPAVQINGRALDAITKDYWAMRVGDRNRDRLYRPITVLSFAVNRVVGGNHPNGYRFVNIVLHALASVLLMWLGLRLGLRETEAGAVALLFALHPIHTEAVNAVVGRADILAAVGVFAGLGILLGNILPPRRADNAASSEEKRRGKKKRAAQTAKAKSWSGNKTWALVGLFTLALFSKEIGLALLLCAGIWWLWCRIPGAENGYSNAEALRQVGWALGVTLVVYLIMRYAALGMWTRPEIPSILDNPLAHEGWGLRQLGAVGVLGRYFRLLIWPWPLSIDYSYAQIQFFEGMGPIWILLGAGLFIFWAEAAYRWRASHPEVAFGLILFIVAFLPVSNFVVPIGTVMAERLIYIPSAGVLLALVPAVVRYLSRWGPRIPLVGLTVVALLFGGMTWLRNGEWSSFVRFWESAATASPNSARALRLYGQSLYRSRKFKEALPPLEKAVRILPKYDEAWVDLGIAQMQSRQEEKAEVSLKEALRLNPSIPEAHLSLGTLYLGTGRPEKGRVHLEKAIALNPGLVEARFNLGTLILREGDPKAAIAHFQAALSADPRRGDVHHNLAIAYLMQGDRVAARRHALGAVRLGVRLHPDLAQNLGLRGRP
jgi:Flp pilus assembly protein TadD